jgi:hypothetical protein
MRLFFQSTVISSPFWSKYSTKQSVLNSRSIYISLPEWKTQINIAVQNIRILLLIKQQIWSESKRSDNCNLTYSIMDGSFVLRIWSVRIQGIDISMGNCNDRSFHNR